MSSVEHDRAPEKGSRWRHPRMRHVWRVESVGPRYITLRPNHPKAGAHRVLRRDWPRDFSGGDWEQA